MEELTWVKDDNGNRASIERWGSEEAARASLATLRDCYDCTDCIHSEGCRRCVRSSYCLRAVDCIQCSFSSDIACCWYCTYTTNCDRSSQCSRSSHCVNCSNCIGELNVTDTGLPEIPVIEGIHGKVLEAVLSAEDALDMSLCHSISGTIHSRAGWVVHLAGEAGYKLEQASHCKFAAMLIYKASGSPVSPCRLYDTNEEALEDIRRCAEQGAAAGVGMDT